MMFDPGFKKSLRFVCDREFGIKCVFEQISCGNFGIAFVDPAVSVGIAVKFQILHIDIAVLVDLKRNEFVRFHHDVVSLATRIALEHGKLVSITEIPLADFNAYRSTLPYYRNIDREGVVIYAA